VYYHNFDPSRSILRFGLPMMIVSETQNADQNEVRGFGASVVAIRTLDGPIRLKQGLAVSA
jgi:hypothetical protein